MSVALDTSYPAGRFGRFGGRYVPEVLVPAMERLEHLALTELKLPSFQREYKALLEHYVGRPTPLTFAPNLSALYGAQIYLKREDLAHTGAHKINNAIGQGLLARRLGAKRVIAETGAGQHGVATAAAAARLGLNCTIYMGAKDIARQAPNVFRMRQLGATVCSVTAGDATLRAAINEAMRDWVSDPEDTYYLLGSAVGPHPYPTIVRMLQQVIGEEAKRQIMERTGRLPDFAVACVGGGSNAIGLFHPFLKLPVGLVGVEAGGQGTEHAATIGSGSPGILHGAFSMLLQDAHGQVQGSHSISAGLDYPGVGPEHAHLAETGRAKYLTVTDSEALTALKELCRAEGILPALESAHALAGARRIATEHPDTTLIVNVSGRGDKDLETLTQLEEGHDRKTN
jgi:tryptophan synthase beta chain